jgi:protein-S-isoprenylcysteine O-methyltransferase Ste14
MKAMSVILKIVSIIGIIAAVHSFLSGNVESSILVLLLSVFVLALGVLFKNLGEAFEDIALMRERQKQELISKGILKQE